MKRFSTATVAAIIMAFSASSLSQYRELSIMELMVTVITPATNTLWGVEDPQSDADWKVLEDAAVITVAAGQQVRQGGAGPNDNGWAANAEWQVMANEMSDAADDQLAAIRSRNLDALFDANDAIYPPCENCHLKFNPAVAAE